MAPASPNRASEQRQESKRHQGVRSQMAEVPRQFPALVARVPRMGLGNGDNCSIRRKQHQRAAGERFHRAIL